MSGKYDHENAPLECILPPVRLFFFRRCGQHSFLQRSTEDQRQVQGRSSFPNKAEHGDGKRASRGDRTHLDDRTLSGQHQISVRSGDVVCGSPVDQDRHQRVEAPAEIQGLLGANQIVVSNGEHPRRCVLDRRGNERPTLEKIQLCDEGIPRMLQKEVHQKKQEIGAEEHASLTLQHHPASALGERGDVSGVLQVLPFELERETAIKQQLVVEEADELLRQAF